MCPSLESAAQQSALAPPERLGFCQRKQFGITTLILPALYGAA